MTRKQQDINWFEELIQIMAQLRAPDGCPWDREQTHNTLKRYLIEETAELIEAIEQGDPQDIKDELGDVLLQVVFHAQIACENGQFNAQDIARNICEKLRRRHPHVFSDQTADTPEKVTTQWEKIKKQERRDKGQTERGTLEGVPKHLPALHRAWKIQKKAAKVGFDWPTVDGVFAKIDEELAEVRQAMAEDNKEAVAEEIGDLLFAVTNLSRFLGHFPEDALHAAIAKVEYRFGKMEHWLKEQGKTVEQCTLDELEALWQRAKA